MQRINAQPSFTDLTQSDLCGRGRERTLNHAYASIASHYRFDPLFCMPDTFGSGTVERHRAEGFFTGTTAPADCAFWVLQCCGNQSCRFSIRSDPVRPALA